MQPKTIDEGKALVEALKTLATAVKLSDLVELTKKEINWTTTPSRKIASLIEMEGVKEYVVRVAPGMYQYREPEPEPPKQKNDSKRKWNYGDVFEGVVSGIVEYGIFLENAEGDCGLVHYSEIRKGDAPLNYSDLLSMFTLGQRVKAVVRGRDRNNKLALSIKAMKERERFAPAKETKETNGGEKEVAATKESTNELTELQNVIKAKVGLISNNANEHLEKLVKEHGALKVALSIGRVVDSFEVDVSLLFVQEVDRKLRDSL